MKTLLSIFPLHEDRAYARIVLTPIEESTLPHVEPFTISRATMHQILRQTSMEMSPEHILQALELRTFIQIPISDDDALVFASFEEGATTLGISSHL